MSDKPISVGDLVQVVRGHVCDLGRVDVVQEIKTHPRMNKWHCSLCGEGAECHEPWARVGPKETFGYPLSWLKRIPPLEELQTYRNTEENPIKVTA